MKKILSFILCCSFPAGLLFAQAGSIQIIAEPGISVHLNGQYIGITNAEQQGLEIENLSAGEFVLKLTRTGFYPMEDTLILIDGEARRYEAGPFISAIKVRPPAGEQVVSTSQGDPDSGSESSGPGASDSVRIAQLSNANTFMVVETMPQFPGGEIALYRFLAENIRYPDEAKRKGIQGRVFVTFIVEVDGSVKEARVLLGIGGGCDEEAVRVVRSMPKWKPGEIKGKPVRVQYNLPIKFTISKRK
jgi:TonB family protein